MAKGGNGTRSTSQLQAQLVGEQEKMKQKVRHLTLGKIYNKQ